MSAEGNGLSLEGLAKRLEALERENTELREEVSALGGSGTRRGEVAELRGSDRRRSRNEERTPEFDGQVSRKALLSKAGAAAVAAVAAATLLNPRQAKAHTASNTIEAHSVIAHTVDANPHSDTVPVRGEAEGTLPALVGLQFGSGAAVLGNNLGGTGAGVKGSSTGNGNVGVHGQKPAGEGHGVLGEGRGSSSAGVFGSNPDGTGVRGESSTVGRAAVVGKHSNAGFFSIGVLGDTVDGVGVKGLGKVGVIGESSTLGHASVYGQHTGTEGYGVVGDGSGSTGSGVLGRNSSGTGVEGTASRYGGKFAGSRAQLMLVPGGSLGKPTTGTHNKGEIYMDKAGALFVCTAGDGTTVGTWKKVNMKLV